MTSNSDPLLRRSARASAIERAVDPHGHITDYFAYAARCTIGEAVVELVRLERQGLVVRGRSGAGMTWKAA